MVARIRNGPGWYCLAVLVLGQLGCARSAALPPPASMRPPPQIISPAPTIPQGGVPNWNVQTQERDLWRPTAKARDWKYVVIHHTASEKGSVESINEEHQQKKDKNGNAWLGIGYHFLIGNGHGMPDGEIDAWRGLVDLNRLTDSADASLVPLAATMKNIEALTGELQKEIQEGSPKAIQTLTLLNRGRLRQAF